MGPRLRAIAGRVPEKCRCLADIGTDHGYIPVDLLRTGRIEHAIAADIGPLPLDHARCTARRYGVEGRIDFRLGDGLKVLSPGEADVILIAGMGGNNIANILAAASWSRDVSLLLLQPMSKVVDLRKWLVGNGYQIRAEYLVQDKGVLYPILVVRGSICPQKGGESFMDEVRAWSGFRLEHDPLWGSYLEEIILRLRRAAEGLTKARDPDLAQRRERFLHISAELEKMKGEWIRANGTGD